MFRYYLYNVLCFIVENMAVYRNIIERDLKTYIKVILLIIFCIVIRIVIGEPCIVPSDSMAPTLLSGDCLWINKLTYGARLPYRWSDIPLVNVFTWIRSLRELDIISKWPYKRIFGIRQPGLHDVVVFQSPEDPRLLLVKRIVQIKKKGDMIHLTTESSEINRSLIERDGSILFQHHGKIYINGVCDSVYVLRQNFYYLRGDNSLNSRDSRFWGYVPEESIVGKFDFVLFSVDPTKNIWTGIRWKRFFKKL